MTVIQLALLGGIVSAVSTGAGSLLVSVFSRFESLRKIQMSMDFALGVMFSAVAFSLVGPELMKGQHLSSVLVGLVIGMGFIYGTHRVIDKLNSNKKYNSYQMMLVAALVFHNFPEGMGAGASLAGMELKEALPLQAAISIQNLAEGLLLTLLLRGLGMSLTASVFGGVASGLVELGGAVLAGFLLQKTMVLLPFLLSVAGGAMMMSVLLEFLESLHLGRMMKVKEFLGGLAVIPLMNLLLGA